ncbi:MAG TPA: 16S rRNA (guanine(527)-N(7))-methyltransferase RsmG [Steroidobacteraceae bacterium]|nr:16S rRNA (guanine(527)-N(7))-methyltransferase RsmG [Steroidobacteraceae bacterium]
MAALELDEAAWKRRLDDGALEMGVQLDESQVEVLWRYGVMLRERNEHVNLTSIVSPEGVLTLHMLDSLSVASHLGDAQNVLDMGTGGGFPGVPLAVAFPDRSFTLIDGTQKKIRFVSESIEALDIRNATAMAARAENLPEIIGDRAHYDVVVARAVASLAELVHNAGRLLAPQGRLLAMKGRLPEEEIRGVPRGWHADVMPLRVPGLDAERHLVSLTRVGKGAAAPGKAKPRSA